MALQSGGDAGGAPAPEDAGVTRFAGGLADVKAGLFPGPHPAVINANAATSAMAADRTSATAQADRLFTRSRRLSTWSAYGRPLLVSRTNFADFGCGCAGLCSGPNLVGRGL
ncbi:hypothetical protein [Mycobacterium branderi]|uniref:Uncharacterized protein n=1 Tax=Mycobacterium branderi TaxID=43348 RepID=A0A7I7WE87_9MYCO|nr:hypothetical protein [Mycobacterium branderi]MCV7236256.1 hypothetical protein [Mycobacterium branderi]ORA35434.1 hypothetical protein BST20_17725 [Mycobacterium branderi]BBZ15135.1 hypothetical protein MBRA_53300 [Mycobacterium branderi]